MRAQALSSAPGSASAEEGYEGSRKQRQRFEYSETSRAGFVELAPGKQFTEQDRLTERRGVGRLGVGRGGQGRGAL